MRPATRPATKPGRLAMDSAIKAAKTGVIIPIATPPISFFSIAANQLYCSLSVSKEKIPNKKDTATSTPPATTKGNM